MTSVDWLAKFRPTLCVDITQWDYRAAFPKDHFHFVWASPACTHFSIARTTGGPRDIEGATALVARCLEIAEYFGCEWCLENPATGLLRRQPLMQGLAWTDPVTANTASSTGSRPGFGIRALSGKPSSPSPSAARRPHAPPSPQTARTPSRLNEGQTTPEVGAQAERRLLAGATVQHAPSTLRRNRPGGGDSLRHEAKAWTRS